MSTRKFNLFYLFKFRSDNVVDNMLEDGFKYTIEEARKDLNLISVGDNQVFQFIRKIKNRPFDLEKLDKIYKLRNDEKSLPKSKRNNNKIDKYQKQIDNMLFVPDIVNVKIEKKKDYRIIARNGFYVNGIKYTRLCCGAGQARRNTVTFVNEEIYDELNEILMCGLKDKLKKTNLGKFSAYYGLFMSATNVITTPNVCVIGDYEHIIKDQETDYIVVNKNGERDIEDRIMDMEMNAFDGQGLVSPEYAELWSEDLGLNYNPSGFIIRSAFIKGLTVPFDFKKFAKEVANKKTIKDIWGVEYNIEDIDVILTASQFKMWKEYTSWQDYLQYFNKYGHQWGCSRVNKEKDDEFALTNYQYLQTLDLTKEDIIQIAKPTVEWIQRIGSGDLTYVLLYLLGCQNDDDIGEEIMKRTDLNFVKGIMLNPDLLNDDYIRTQIYKSLKKKINEAKVGRLWVRGNYQFLISDPYAFCEWAFGMDNVMGLLNAEEIYSNFWKSRNVNKVAMERSPLVDKSEHRVKPVMYTEEMAEWYKYIQSGIVLNIHDLSVMYHSDCDFDGDIIFSTDNDIIINSIYPNCKPITYGKRKVPNQKLTKLGLIKNDIRCFDTKIGQITNVASSIVAKMENFEKGSKEWLELEKRVKLLRMFQGEQIDATKGLEATPVPKYWYKKQKIDYEKMTKEEVEKLEFNNRIVADKKPYFMGYVYPKLLDENNKFIKKTNTKSLRRVGVGLGDLFTKENKTEKEKQLLYQYNKYQPTLKNRCVMNELCFYVEQMDFDLKFFSNKNKKEKFDYKILLSEDYVVRPRSVLYGRIDELIKKYKTKMQDVSLSTNMLMNSFLNKKELEEFVNEVSFINYLYFLEKDIERIGIQTQEIYNYFVEIIYSKYKQGYNILWDIFNEDILSIINKGKIIVPIQDENGETIYFGKRYTLKEVELINDNI